MMKMFAPASAPPQPAVSLMWSASTPGVCVGASGGGRGKVGLSQAIAQSIASAIAIGATGRTTADGRRGIVQTL